MKRIVLVLTGMLLACNGVRGFIIDEEIFSHRSVDSLAPRDDYDLLHQMPTVRATDYAHRDSRRWVYYFKGDRLILLFCYYEIKNAAHLVLHFLLQSILKFISPASTQTLHSCPS